MSAAAKQTAVNPSDRDSLTVYLQAIRRYPLLTQAEEVELARRIREGDPAASERLICSNLRFVVSVAKKYQNQGVALGDLINEGNMGLIRAADRFDENKGVKFISYAVWWIRQAIFQAIADHGRPVRVPIGRAGQLARLDRKQAALRQDLGREPTIGEIGESLDRKDVDSLRSLELIRSSVSLDAPVGEDEDTRLLDYIADDHGAAPDAQLADDNLVECTATALGSLRPREAQILRMYFGIGSEDSMTLEEIGDQLHITRERVRQIRDRALDRLRKSPHAVALESLQG